MAARGATLNRLSTRFSQRVREADPAEAETNGGAGAWPTTVTVERPRTILSRNESPDIPFDLSLNAYRGCEHGCIYCFARPSHGFHGLSPGLDFETQLFAKPDAALLLARAFDRAGYTPQVLAIGTNTDPYQPIEKRWAITRAVLELCTSTRHPISIATKAQLVLRDLDLLAPMAEQGLAHVTISLTTLQPELARRMEPRASAPHRRLAAMAGLAAAGVPVTVALSPIIPALNDHEVEALALAAAAAGARHLVWQPIRLPHEVAPLFEAWLETHYPERRARVLSAIRAMRGGRLNDPRFHHRMAPDGVWPRLIEQRVTRAAAAHGLGRSRPMLRTDLFRAPGRLAQGELF